jgi:hypothetical protein
MKRLSRKGIFRAAATCDDEAKRLSALGGLACAEEIQHLADLGARHRSLAVKVGNWQEQKGWGRL